MLSVKVVWEDRKEKGNALWVYIKSPGVYPIVIGPTYYTPKAMQDMQKNFPDIMWEQISKPKTGDTV